MKSVYRSITAAMFSFFASLSFGQYSITTNGTVLADDLTSGSRVVVDAFLNCSNRVQVLIENIVLQEGITTNDIQLAPVYSQTPTFGDEWVCTPATYNGKVISIYHVAEIEDVWGIHLDGIIAGPWQGTEDSTSLFWPAGGWDGDVDVTATRVRTDIIGYTLGDQTNSVLASTNAISRSGGGLTTNDVCAIVTNEVATFGEWVLSIPDELTGEGLEDWRETVHDETSSGHVSIRTNEIWIGQMNASSPQNVSQDGTELKFNGEGWAGLGTYLGLYEGDIIATRMRIIRNALGLARLSDIAPSISNTVTKAYVEDLGIESGVDAQTVTNMTTLTPVYSQTPTFGEWVCDPDVVTVYWDSERGMWQTSPLESSNDPVDALDPNATRIEFVLEGGEGYITATRTRTDIIGYVLGVQTNRAIAATNSLISAEAVTNIASVVVAAADTSYPRYTVLTNINQSVQYLSIADEAPSTLSIQIPADGRTKDWVVYVTTVTNATLSLPAGTWWMADHSYTNDIAPATPTALWFSQVTDGVYILGRQELTEVTAP